MSSSLLSITSTNLSSNCRQNFQPTFEKHARCVESKTLLEDVVDSVNKMLFEVELGCRTVMENNDNTLKTAEIEKQFAMVNSNVRSQT
mmetsp:Transcript_50261/g.157061  ORF Transcript_50261/g.157061 Transcript_50261/m.157061 type:complete len:88 (+) Transcript_50261:44-307(+)